jgi:hypothetical protein
VNVALDSKSDVKVKLPVVGHVRDLVSGAEVPVTDGVVTMSFYPGELKALRVTAEPTTGPSDPGPGTPTNPSATPASDPESSGCSCDMSSLTHSAGGNAGAILALGSLLLMIRRRK